MIPVSNEFLQGLKRGENLRLRLEIKTKEKEFILSFDDISNLEYSSSATDEKRFHFGRMAACGLDITLVDTERWRGEALKGGIIRPYFFLTDVADRVPLGVFTIEEVHRKPNEYFLRCADDMVKFDIKWKSNQAFKFPCTATALLQKMCEYAKVTYSTNNPTIDFMIDSEKPFKGKTLRSILGLLGETQGMYSIINRTGELQLKRIGGESVYTVNYEDLTDFIPDEEEISPNGSTVEIKGTTHTGEGVIEDIIYFIRLSQNNILLKEKSSSNIKNVLNAITNGLSGLQYLPCVLETPFGNPALEAGDIITVTDKEGNPHNAIVGRLEFTDNFSMKICSAGESADLNNQNFSGALSEKLNDAMNIEGLPDMSGYNGATLRTDGTMAYWSKSDSSIKEIRPVDGMLRLDATLDNGVYFAKDIGSSVAVSVINTNSLLPDSVKDIILLFDSAAKVNISWDGTIHPNDDDIINTEPNRYNEYILRCYRCFGTTWLMTRQVF